MMLSAQVQAQYFKVSGVVLNTNKEPLPLASVGVRELHSGIITKDNGSFEFSLERGKYEFVVTMVGYQTKVVSVQVNNADVVQDIIMDLDSSNLSEVVIRVKARDRAEEIIRNVIRNKETIQSSTPYSCSVYIKASQVDSSYSKRKKEGNKDSMENAPDFNAMSLAEISLRFDKNSNGQMKEERLGVKKDGDVRSLFYLSATESDLNIYNNLLKAPTISAIPFVSPLSYSGLIAYRFKTVKIDRTGKRKIYTISVRPRLLSNATVEGELTIIDSSWVVTKADFRLPSSHLPEYDFFEVNQQFDNISDSTWMMSRQQFDYYSKTKTGKNYGQTVAVYSHYELNKKFRKGYFGNEVSSTSMQAYEKDSAFWNSVRAEPLSRQELLYSRYRDSLFTVMHTEAYLDSMDRIMNKITWNRMLVFGQIINDHKKQRTWILPPVTTIFLPFQFGGSRLSIHVLYKKIFPSRKDITLDMKVSYGFRNKDVNGAFDLRRMYNPFNRGYYRVAAGRDFNYIYGGDAWINMIKRSNIYLDNYFTLGHGLELVNGLYLSNDLEIALNRSVAGYKINPKVDSIFGDFLTDNQPQDFKAYNAFYSKVKLEFTPFQKYMREPKEKIILGSKWPTFYVLWRKGIPGVFKSEINFDYLEYGMQQKINMGVAGVSTYTIKTGSFPNMKDLRLIDYTYQRRGDPIYFHDPYKLFQALDSTFPVFKRFYQGNYVHEFNGALINKIPFMKKLKLNEIAGGGFLISQERNLHYAEIFAGLERIFKFPLNPLSKFKLGIYVVGSAANQFRNPVEFKIGLTTWDRYSNKWK
ncbi:MAG: carboxypeptidase-like regulatory domain-containing protein [Bacteroidetes bacterium]|nr:carboxypeptidase-like regulatory domain-containing protein [Bacteroidota bacterium]MBS1931308.1 carboxypeptidase-like regulatory domain-containing protein [Bacteroidota bacterium]